MNFISYFFNEAIKENINRIYIEAQGGFGKSFGLKKLCYSIVRDFQNLKMIPIYIDIKKLAGLTVEEYIIREYCYVASNKSTEINFVLRDNNYKYLIVLDGLNEASEADGNNVVYGFIDSTIATKADYNNVYIVVASRYYDKSIKNILQKGGYKHIIYKPFNEHFVESIVKKELSSYSKDLVNVLKNPMMLSIFNNTIVKDKYCNAKHQSDVLDVFFEEQIKISSTYRKYSSEEKTLFEFVVTVFLPVLLEENKYIYTKSEIKDLINSVSKNEIFANRIIENDYDEIDYDFKVIMKILCNDLNLFSKSGTTLVIHQVFNDYFISKYYYEEIVGWLEKPYEDPEFVFSSYNSIENCKFRRLSPSVKDYFGSLASDELKHKVPDKLRMSKLATEKYIIAQTVEILKFSDNLDDCDFSHLDLEFCNFRSCSMKRVNFSNSQISENSFHLPIKSLDTDICVIDSSDDFLVLCYNGDILCVSLKDYSVIYQIKAINKLNVFVRFDDGEIVLALHDKIEIYNLEFGFKKQEILFYDIFDGRNTVFTDFYYDVDCDAYICYDFQQNKMVVLDSCFRVLFCSYINDNDYKLKYFNGKGVLYNYNDDLYNWSLINIDLPNETINISKRIISTDLCELQFLLHQNNLIVCGLVGEELIAVNITENKKEVLQNVKGINFCNSPYNSINTLSVFTKDNNDRSLSLENMLSIIDERVIDLLFQSEYERYLLKKPKNINENYKKSIDGDNDRLNKSNRLFSSSDAFFIELFGQENQNFVGSLNRESLLKKFKQYLLFSMPNNRCLLYSKDNTWIVLNLLGEELGRFKLNDQIIQPIYFESYTTPNHDELYIETTERSMLYDLKNCKIREKITLDQDYVSTIFVDGYALQKKIIHNLEKLYDLPSEIRVLKEGKDNLWHFYDKINIDKIPGFGTAIPGVGTATMYINAQLGKMVIFSIFNNETIDVFTSEYDFQNKTLNIKSKLNMFFNTKLYCIVPSGYRQIDDKTILVLKFLENNDYRIIIIDASETIVFDCSYCTIDNIVKTVLTKDTLYVVFEKSVCVVNLRTLNSFFEKTDEKIVSACKYKNNSMLLLYENNKIARVVFDFNEKSAIFKNTLIVIPSTDLEGSSFEDAIIKNDNDDFIDLIKYNC